MPSMVYSVMKNPHMDVTAALFIIAKAWKQPRYLSEGKMINKLC